MFLTAWNGLTSLGLPGIIWPTAAAGGVPDGAAHW
jgi:hypothetical protein